MLRLAGGTHFLVLRRAADFSSHSIQIRRRFDEAVANWQLGDRVSPIYPIDNAPIPALLADTTTWAIFMGPCDPGRTGPASPAFLTHGLFNLLVFAASPAERDSTVALAEAQRLRWEEWTLAGNGITDIRSGPAATSLEAPRAATEKVTGQPPALDPALREYRALMGTAMIRALVAAPEIAAELASFNSVFRASVADERVHPVVRLGSLVTVNAALSRLSSQCFSGTSPILETESHFWTHSLLGIGIPCLAIARLRRFTEQVLGQARFGDRLAALTSVPPHAAPLETLSAGDPFWSQDVLFGSQIQLAPEERGDQLPLITFFSGRDGNHSTHFSLSVPLEVVSSCNAISWTLRTVTHELSHSVVDLVLARLLPRSSDFAAVDHTVAILGREANPLNLFEQLRAYVCHALVAMDLGPTQDLRITRSALSDRIRLRTPHFNEILTHVFDFLYFYRKDPAKFVRSLWASWAVIPNIQSRVPDYVVRSLCALMANHLRRENGLDVACEQLRNQLVQVRSEFPSAAYIGDALATLQDDLEHLKYKVAQRLPIVRFVRNVLYSANPDRDLIQDPLAGMAESGGYNIAALEFDERVVSSPLAFVEFFSNEAQGDGAKSAWILHKLAFSSWLSQP